MRRGPPGRGGGSALRGPRPRVEDEGLLAAGPRAALRAELLGADLDASALPALAVGVLALDRVLDAVHQAAGLPVLLVVLLVDAVALADDRGRARVAELPAVLGGRRAGRQRHPAEVAPGLGTRLPLRNLRPLELSEGDVVGQALRLVLALLLRLRSHGEGAALLHQQVLGAERAGSLRAVADALLLTCHAVCRGERGEREERKEQEALHRRRAHGSLRDVTSRFAEPVFRI
mmetsp:Transcript_30831/g.83524  ORF Transcript_30831/g.83524 Transcript_30831/m.83524 type:complete len:232 (-) Transcript_30831:13-708(-)